MQFPWTETSWFIPWMEVRCKYLDMGGGETRPGWQWDVNIEALVEVRQDVHGGDIHISRWDVNTWILLKVKQYMDGVETRILWSGCSWYRTGMEVKSTYKFWVVLRWCLDRTEMQFSGIECSWDVTWIEVRHRYQDLHRGETRHG